MVRKGNWFSNVKKALSPDSKDKKEEKSSKSKKKWFGNKPKHAMSSDAPPTAASMVVEPQAPAITFPPPPPPQEETELEIERHVVARHSPPPEPPAEEAEPVHVVVAQVTTRASRFVGRSAEESAAIHIQTAFRGYLARRALRALRGLVRLKAMMEGSAVKRQATSTLKCMQTLSRVQSQIRSRRIRMLEENQALQRQLLQKHAKDFHNLRAGEVWDDSLQSKEQVEASVLNKYEASVRRERALAYAFSHQQALKNPGRSANPMFMDPRNPTWGWSWLERWMAARPWETKDSKETNNAKDMSGGEINKSYARFLLNSDKLSSPTAQKPSPTNPFQSPATPVRQSPANPFQSPARQSPAKKGSPRMRSEEDVRSVQSEQQRPRRHSIAGGSSVGAGDDTDSLASSPALPSYMVPTESARAKSRLNGGGSAGPATTPESAKKRLHFPPSPRRRHSGPPKIDATSLSVATTDNNDRISVVA